LKKFVKFIILIVSLALVLAATTAWAQRGMGPGGGQGRGWGAAGSYSRMYDPKTVETISGEVVSVDKFTPGKRMSYGVHFTLKTEKETIPVHLGPSWYMEKQAVTIAQGDSKRREVHNPASAGNAAPRLPRLSGETKQKIFAR
jgi:hypothetical protein